MGACSFGKAGSGKDAREVFDRLTADSQYESGHSYSGEIGMKYEFVTVGTAETLAEAQKLGSALIRAGDFDKWGPAGCFEITKPDHPEWGKQFYFFGMAPE